MHAVQFVELLKVCRTLTELQTALLKLVKMREPKLLAEPQTEPWYIHTQDEGYQANEQSHARPAIHIPTVPSQVIPDPNAQFTRGVHPSQVSSVTEPLQTPIVTSHTHTHILTHTRLLTHTFHAFMQRSLLIVCVCMRGMHPRT